MTTYNTGNPLGSADPRDLFDNAENLDGAVNSTTSDTWVDRLGVTRKTFKGMEREFDSAQTYRESRFNDFIAASGYQFLGDYGPGIEFTEYNQLVRDENGEFWRLSGQVELPYTTTGAGLPEDDSFTPLGDAVLRQELANPNMGAAMVARGVVAVDSIADLMAMPEGQRQEGLRYLVKGYHAGSDIGGGEFYWTSSDVSTKVAADTLSGLYVAPASDPSGENGAWVRIYSGAINVLWFGVQFGVDESTKISSIASLLSDGDSLYFPHGDYVFADPYISGAANFQNISDITVFGDYATVTQPVESGTGRLSTRKTLFFYNCKNVKVSGFTFVGNHANGDSEGGNNHRQNAITVSGCSSVLVENCDAKWFNRGFVSQQSSQVRIINCKAENTYNGFLATYSDDVKIDMCVAKDTRYAPNATDTSKSAGYGFLSDYSKNIIFSSCISYRSGSECFRAQGDSTHGNIFFNNCISILCKRYAFSSRGFHGLVQFNNCIVKDAGDPTFWDGTSDYTEPVKASVIAFLADSPKVSLYGCSVDIANELSPSSGGGYGVSVTTSSFRVDLVIGNSSFKLPGGFYGIFTNTSLDVALRVHGTEIESQGLVGPFAGVIATSGATKSHSIRDCTITGFLDGIRLGAFGSSATSNIIRGVGRHGIYCTAGAAIISENSISDVGLVTNGAGIAVQRGSGSIVSNNNIEDTAATPTTFWGIYITGAAKDIIFGRNRINNVKNRIRNDAGVEAYGSPLHGKASLVGESTATDVAGIVSDFNNLIAKLKSSDLMDRQ